VLAIWGCSPPGGSGSALHPGGGSWVDDEDYGVDDTGSDDGDSGGADTGDERDPVWTADEAAEHFVWTLSQGFPTPMVLWTYIEDLVAQGDEDCPGEGPSWYMEQGGCLSTSGYLYRGQLDVDMSESSDESGTSQTLASTLAIFSIGTPDGEEFRTASHWRQSVETLSNGNVAGRIDFVGSVEYPPATEPWLSGTTSMTGAADAALLSGDEESTLSVGGQFSLGWGGHALRLDGVSYASNSCETWPVAGSIEVWSPEGIWTRADFTTDCVCPSWVDAYGNDLGESCVDLSPAFEAIAVELQVTG